MGIATQFFTRFGYWPEHQGISDEKAQIAVAKDKEDNMDHIPQMLHVPHYRTVELRHPVAAKDYECSICGKAIAKGEEHIRALYRDGKYLQPARYHLRCTFE